MSALDLLSPEARANEDPASQTGNSIGDACTSASTDVSWHVRPAGEDANSKFTMRLDASPGAPPLGLVLATGSTVLLVKNISEFPNALAQAWNVEHPATSIMPGDSIVRVNEVTGSGEEMVKELKRGGILEITVNKSTKNLSAQWSTGGTDEEEMEDNVPIPACLTGSIGTLRRRTSLDAPSGTLEENYEVGETLGKGAYGLVRKAKSVNSGVTFAVKSIAFSKLKVGKDYEQELKVLKRLNHPHIIHLSEVYQDREHMHFILDYCAGGSLEDKIKSVDAITRRTQHRAGLPTGTLEKAAVQILMAITYLHHHRFAHRDIKPENFLLIHASSAESLNLKLVDFGLSCRFEPGKKMRAGVGTTYYLAPEVLSGEYTEKVDLWSAGVTLFQCTIGTVPFTGQHRKDVFQKIKAGDMEWNEHSWKAVNSEFRGLVKELLTLDPEARPSAKDLFQNNKLLQRLCKSDAKRRLSQTKGKKFLGINFKDFMPKRRGGSGHPH